MDNLFEMIPDSLKNVSSYEISKAVVKILDTKKAEDIKDITGSTHYVGLLNEMLSAPAPSFSAFDTASARSG